MKKLTLPSALAALIACGLCAAAGPVLLDRLERPATMTKLSQVSTMAGVARAGTRLVAVGVRGAIILSDDAGATWRQTASPVAVDLLAVHFPTPDKGWAVGHDGVVLHSTDGGQSWRKQLDGNATAALLARHFEQKAAGGDADAKRWLENVRLNYTDGPEQALLDVWFEDDLRGFVVGSFGTILRTTDGGKTWVSWMEKIQSPELVHLNAIRGVGGQIFIGSERGVVFRLDTDRETFVPSETGYRGSFFAVAGKDQDVTVAGLRGTAYRSRDSGKSWQKLETGLVANITAAVALEDGRTLLASQDGRAIVIGAAAGRPSPIAVAHPTLLTGAVQMDGATLVLTGLNGVQRARLQ